MAASARREASVAFNRFDLVALLVSGVALVMWIGAPETVATSALFLVAAMLQTVRLWRWAGPYVWREPLVLVLHLAYAFVPLGFLLGGLSTFEPLTLAGTAAMHAWTVGAIGIMTLAVMTRATRPHRPRAHGIRTYGRHLRIGHRRIRVAHRCRRLSDSLWKPARARGHRVDRGLLPIPAGIRANAATAP